MASKLMRRAERNARVISRGDDILSLMKKANTRHKLVAAAKAGAPPVTAISAQLRALVGSDAKLAAVKQFAGLCVRAVLEEEGYELTEKGVRISTDPIFRTGSTYRRAAVRSESDPSWPRFVDMLSEDEAEQLLKALLARKRRR